MVVHEDKYEHISEKMRDLIRLMLTPNPSKRPSVWDLEVIVEAFD
jgi:serine/threonine protein kinase